MDDTTYTGPDGTEVTLDINAADTLFSFTFEPGSNMVAYDLIVKGGAKNTHYDYDGGPGPIAADGGLHAPTKGGSSNLYSLSQINLCYDTFVASASGVKFHDRDVDGDFDVTEEERLSGWPIAVFNQAGAKVQETTTDANGFYSFTDLSAGDIICEATNTEGLPTVPEGEPWTWVWVQSAPAADPPNTLCSGKEGYEPAGYEVTVDDALLTGADFGNHTQVAIDCSGPDPVSVDLGGEGTLDDPLATVTLPANCESGTFRATFDVGRSDMGGGDPDRWSHFVVVVPSNPDSAQIIDLNIVWDSEPRNPEVGDLIVPNTKVVLDGDPVPQPGDELEDAVLCNTLTGGLPTAETSTCLFQRTISEGGTVPAGDIQVTELFKFLGDPRSYR